MNLKNQQIFDDLDNTLNSTLEFLKSKASRIKELENELDELENEINFDISKGLDVDKKQIKLKDLQDALYEYEMRPSDILVECTHINNINNCIAKINGNRIKTYGDAKLEHTQDLESKEKLAKIIANMENEFSKIKEETDIKVELRNKIVNSEMHVNSLDARIKLYDDNFKSFIKKEKELKDEIAKFNDDFNSTASIIENNNKKINSLTDEINSYKTEIESKTKEIKNIEDEIEVLNNKTKELGPIITNDITKLEESKEILKEKIVELKANVTSLTKEKIQVEKELRKNKIELNKKEDKEPLINSTINFINTQFNSIEDFEDINELWENKFSNFKENVDIIAKENNYKYSNANGEDESPVNPLIEYTDKLRNMISFIQQNDIIIDEHDDVEPEIIYRDKPKESKLNPIVIGAIAIGGALILSKTNN